MAETNKGNHNGEKNDTKGTRDPMQSIPPRVVKGRFERGRAQDQAPSQKSNRLKDEK
jgi:hypothetical protein